jgi:hypothetical protein
MATPVAPPAAPALHWAEGNRPADIPRKLDHVIAASNAARLHVQADRYVEAAQSLRVASDLAVNFGIWSDDAAEALHPELPSRLKQVSISYSLLADSLDKLAFDFDKLDFDFATRESAQVDAFVKWYNAHVASGAARLRARP